jgi:hypothetical protein
MGWNYYRKERAGKWYWYAQRSVRVPGRKYPKSETRYIGRCARGHGIWSKKELKDSLIGARWKYRVEIRAKDRTPEEKESLRNFNSTVRTLQREAEARQALHELEERENARQPATEAARDRYMALREQQQGEIRAYWKTVEDETERADKANQQWAAERAAEKESTNSSEPASASEPSPQGEPAPDAAPSSSDGPR